MNLKNKIPTQNIVREMYSDGWISSDLFLNGGVSFDLILMFTHKIEIIQQRPFINFDIHFYNDVTVYSQIQAYTELIEETEYFVDYFTEPILDKYKEQLIILNELQGVIQIQLN